MQKKFLHGLFGAALVCAAAGAQAQADHLLLSEVGIGPSEQDAGFSTEYVEIYNPTAAPVSLDNYYLSDVNNYKNHPTSPDSMSGGNTDNIFRFPAGAVLQPGQYAVVTGGGTNFLNAYFGRIATHADFRQMLPGEPLLFEVGETDDSIPNMAYFNTGGTPSNLNFTNASAGNGEFVVLFHWDGTSDLVDDVDIVTWGFDEGVSPDSTNRFHPKTASDTGLNNTPYLPDAGSHESLSVGSSGYQLITRISTTETGEVQTNGNGITGHDESTEDVASTWVGGNFDDGDHTPGYSREALTSEAPVVASAVRNVQYPAPGEDVTITAEVSDPDGTVASVEVYVRTTTGFTAVAATEGDPGVWTANIGSFANGTVVDYYVSATDDTGATDRFPQLGTDDGPLTGFHVTDNPVGTDDVIVNEFLHDNPGSDAYEFIELYNRRNQPLDLSYFRVADATSNFGILPRGAVIPANGYMVVSLDPRLLLENYAEVPGVSYYDWGTFQLNGGGDTIRLAHANEFGAGDDSAATWFEEFAYGDAAPWPTDFAGTLRTMELKHPSLDRTLAENWAAAPVIGTPGAQNSVYTEGAVIGNVARDVEFPASNSPIVISANVTHPFGTIDEVRAMVDTGSGFTAFPMTASGTEGAYTVELPGFADDTIVRYYIEAEDTNGVEVTSPLTAPEGFNVFIVDDNPPVDGDLVINEILYDNISGDQYEFVEIYNNTDQPISLAYFRIGDLTSNYLEFPADAVIAPNGFVVATMKISLLNLHYVIPEEVPQYEVPYTLNNDTDLVYIAHPNSVDFGGTTTYLDEVTYTKVAPWPAIDANATGQSIELLSPDLDNSQGENWAAAIIVGPYPGSGTPGLPNTAEASVADWNLY